MARLAHIEGCRQPRILHQMMLAQPFIIEGEDPNSFAGLTNGRRMVGVTFFQVIRAALNGSKISDRR
jgi:hypothetical protein